jgi:hypothetical protein
MMRPGDLRGMMRLTLLLGAVGLARADPGAKRPNIIMVFADDMGWGDLGANLDSVIPSTTPHLDALAASGVRFTDLHSGASVCTPARGALLTGRLGLRTGITNNFSPGAMYGIPSGEARTRPSARPPCFVDLSTQRRCVGRTEHTSAPPPRRPAAAAHLLPCRPLPCPAARAQVTVAELLSDVGYDTLMLGKWHLGHHEGYRPVDRGFDAWFGVPYS